MKERIQKIIAESGLCSRRKAEELIMQGKVTRNGRPAHIGDKADVKNDRIAVDGQVINERSTFRYLMLYKPRGYITTLSDEKGRKCVADLIRNIPQRVYPVGRLDVNSEGLLLLTNDGEFANRMMHPSCEVSKTYRVTIRPSLNEEQAAALASGINLDGKMTKPARLNVLSEEPGRVVIELTIHEGRNRQIRRMVEALGLEVVRLKRISEGSIRLGMLRPGEYRDLTGKELEAIKRENKKMKDEKK